MSSEVSQEPISQEANNTSIKQEAKSKPKNHFMQINPHINLIYNDIDDLHQSIYENKKKCYMLKGSLQTSMNLIKEQSNALIKDFVKQISDLRDTFTNETKGFGLMFENIKTDVNKLKEQGQEIKNNVEICEYRVNRCENDIGYHLLGNKSKSSIFNKEDEHREETK